MTTADAGPPVSTFGTDRRKRRPGRGQCRSAECRPWRRRRRSAARQASRAVVEPAVCALRADYPQHRHSGGAVDGAPGRHAARRRNACLRGADAAPDTRRRPPGRAAARFHRSPKADLRLRRRLRHHRRLRRPKTHWRRVIRVPRRFPTPTGSGTRSTSGQRPQATCSKRRCPESRVSRDSPSSVPTRATARPKLCSVRCLPRYRRALCFRRWV